MARLHLGVQGYWTRTGGATGLGAGLPRWGGLCGVVPGGRGLDGAEKVDGVEKKLSAK